MDGYKLRRREGYRSGALRKTGDEARRNALLTAIVKARGWIDDIRLGPIGAARRSSAT